VRSYCIVKSTELSKSIGYDRLVLSDYRYFTFHIEHAVFKFIAISEQKLVKLLHKLGHSLTRLPNWAHGLIYVHLTECFVYVKRYWLFNAHKTVIVLKLFILLFKILYLVSKIREFLLIVWLYFLHLFHVIAIVFITTAIEWLKLPLTLGFSVLWIIVALREWLNHRHHMWMLLTLWNIAPRSFAPRLTFGHDHVIADWNVLQFCPALTVGQFSLVEELSAFFNTYRLSKLWMLMIVLEVHRVNLLLCSTYCRKLNLRAINFLLDR